MRPLQLSHYTLSTCLGAGRAAQLDALRSERSGLQPCDFDDVNLPAWIGRVSDVEATRLPTALVDFTCRNNQLAWLGLQQDGFLDAVAELRSRISPQRIGVFMGTSTSGVFQTELAYRARSAEGALPDWFSYRHSQNCYSVTDFVRSVLGLTGPALTISTACSSSAKVFATASRYLEAGWIDAAVVGGVDSLCLTTLYGFSALQLVSPEPCRPADATRKGISIGEASGFALLERVSDRQKTQFRGYGESSDAHHMSTPHPEGAGAARAMREALLRAALNPDDISYINLHGTATPANDVSEGRAVHSLFGSVTPASSTKGWTGHCLGAAGIVEALFCAIALEEGLLLRSLNTETIDPAIQHRVQMETRETPLRHALSNSFGFGGNNSALVLSHGAAA